MLWLLLLSFVIFLCIVGWLIGTYFFRMAIARNKKSFIHNEASVGPAYDWFYHASNLQDIYITSYDGLRLHAYLIPCKQPTRTYGIVVHGYSGQASLMAPATQHFHEQGYGVLVCDLRAHGKSEGNVIGFGGKDREDLLSWSKYLIENKNVETIFLYGVSMGASSVMMCADCAVNQIKCIIEDCGYTSLKQQFSYLLDTKFHYPKAIVLPCANLVMKKRAHYQMQEVEPIAHVAAARVPILFLHGNQDDFVPFFMLEELYQACPTSKSKVVIDGAGHAQSRRLNPGFYWDKVDTWLQQHLM